MKLAEQLEKLPEDARNNRKSLNEKIANSNRMVNSLRADLSDVQQGVLGITDAGVRPESQASIPIVSVSRDVISKTLEASTGKKLVELEAAIDETGSPHSVLLEGVTVVLKSELRPSVAETRTGSINPAAFVSKRPPNPPKSVLAPARFVRFACGAISSTNASPSSMSTPVSLYL